IATQYNEKTRQVFLSGQDKTIKLRLQHSIMKVRHVTMFVLDPPRNSSIIHIADESTR
ncbi:hypothetical protein L9F63_027450, partial [Diploptera punctata]